MVTRRNLLRTAALGTVAPALLQGAEVASALTTSTTRTTPKVSAPSATLAAASFAPALPPLNAQAPTPGSLAAVGGGYTIANSQGDQIMPIETFRAELARARQAGASWVRLGIPLWLVGGVWNGAWSTYDPQNKAVLQQFSEARAAGFRIACTLTAPTENPQNKTMTTFLEMNRQAIKAIATTVGNYVDVWQVFNEWNLSHYRTNAGFSFEQSLNPTSSYLTEVRGYLDMAAKQLRSQYPSTIISSALGGYPADDARWASWERIYTATGASLSAWGVNAYPDPGVPEQVLAQTWLLQRMRAVSNKPVFIFETGMSTGTAASMERAKVMLPQMLHSLAWGAPLALFSYQLRDLRTGDSDGEMNFGLYRTDGSLKPFALEAINAMTSIVRTPVVA